MSNQKNNADRHHWRVDRHAGQLAIVGDRGLVATFEAGSESARIEDAASFQNLFIQRDEMADHLEQIIDDLFQHLFQISKSTGFKIDELCPCHDHIQSARAALARIDKGD